MKTLSAVSRERVSAGASLRPAAPSRAVCCPLALAPGPRAAAGARSPRRLRARLVTTNFKQNDDQQHDSQQKPPASRHHPLTEDPFSGAGPAETATQEVLYGTKREPRIDQVPPLLRPVANTARQVAHLMRHPRALLRAAVRNSAAYGLPLVLAYLARGPLQSFWTFYCASLDSYPLLTKIATGIVGTAIGDYIAQTMQHQTDVKAAQVRGEQTPGFTLDLTRMSRLILYGALFGTPVGHFWFSLLDTHVMPNAMTSPAAVLSKMCLDQLVACPLLTATFFVVMRIWEGHPGDALDYMKAKMVPTMSANYLLWPIAHLINFAFVPPSQRILYCNAVGVLWTVILSTILNSRAPSPEAVAATAGGASPPGASPSRRPPHSPPHSPTRGSRSPPSTPPSTPPRGPIEIVPGIASLDLGGGDAGMNGGWGSGRGGVSQRASSRAVRELLPHQRDV